MAELPRIPGWSLIFSASSRMWQAFHPGPSLTSMESVMAWPERLVPAALNVRGRPRAPACRITSTTSGSFSTVTAIFGTSR